ncbi:MAG: phosphatidate cytidylyltransferase [Niabella sp.]
MAFNWSTFWTRAFTALIFVAVMMFGLLYSNWSLFLLVSVIHFGCWWEYCRLVEKKQNTFIHPYAKLGWSLLGYHFFIWLAAGDLRLLGYSVKDSFSLPFLLAGCILTIWGVFKIKRINSAIVAWCIGGLAYISLALGSLINIADIVDLYRDQGAIKIPGFHVVLFIIGSVWVNDTMAYLAGSVIGKTPLSKISPKKTWEGTISGIILSAALTWLLYSLIFLKGIFWVIAPAGIAISAIAAISGTFGDLFESKLKRMAGVKDSGHIMPGHGGFLDRFDSILFAAPAVWLFIRIFS